MQMDIKPKHSVEGATIFSVMSALAAQCGAINLSQGFPDYNIDEPLSEWLGKAALEGFNQYAPMPGLPLLRNMIAADFGKRYGVDVDADKEITVTPGATYAIYTAFTSILRPGDEVILFEPAYDSYIPNIEMNGGVAIPIPLVAPHFGVDWNKVKDAITSRTRAIILNTPNNPTGAIWSAEDWDTLADLVRNTDIMILSDEVYEQLVFDGAKHHSVLQHAELRERSFALFSFGKVYNNTGWKIGYCIAPDLFTKAFRSVHQFLSFSVNTPAQYAIASYMQQNGRSITVGAEMQQKRDYFLSVMKNTSFTVHLPARGSYFQVASYERISDKPDLEFAQWLTREHGVATIPVSAFYKSRKDDKLLRFCFAKQQGTIDAAIKKLGNL